MKEERGREVGRLIIDESVSDQAVHEFTKRHFAELRWTEVIAIREQNSGIPDSEILRHLLRPEDVLLTSDRQLHNAALKKKATSFLVTPDGGFSRAWHKGAKPVTVLQNAPPTELKDWYHPPKSGVRPFLLPDSEKALKTLSTKRRRIRNHFGGLQNIQELALTVSRSGRLIGIHVKASSTGQQKAIRASESYIREVAEEPGIAALCHALILVVQLMLQSVPVKLFYDEETIPNPSGVREPLFGLLLGEFKQVVPIACVKGPYLEELRRKLANLTARPGNEVLLGDLSSLRAKIPPELVGRVSQSERESVEADRNTDRGALLHAGRVFLGLAARLEEVQQTALIGSMTTEKKKPKDIDFLVTVKPRTDLRRLAKAARRLSGEIARGRLGSDVFVVEEGDYLGRTCRFTDPWQRRQCLVNRLACCTERKFLCDTSSNFRLAPELIADPPIVLFPEFRARVPVPKDVTAMLCRLLTSEQQRTL
ncbi:MAG: hypothetical protein ACE15E_02035 [Acidobacteriota bacterium]